ncbi:hypothetical protein MRB53_038198 [Persea americana]|nr:hypothetical protein MRB53_038198 [Persea americana]
MDAFAKYSNLAGFLIGNEIINARSWPSTRYRLSLIGLSWSVYGHGTARQGRDCGFEGIPRCQRLPPDTGRLRPRSVRHTQSRSTFLTCMKLTLVVFDRTYLIISRVATIPLSPLTSLGAFAAVGGSS